MNIEPIFDRVVLKVENKTQTQSGIVLPSSSEDKSQIATVVAVGSGLTNDGKKVEMQVAVGQKVVFSKYAGTEIIDKDEKYIIVSQADILAIVK